MSKKKQRSNTFSTSNVDDGLIVTTIIALGVGIAAGFAIVLPGRGSRLLPTDVAIAAGFVFHLAGLQKMDGRHTGYLNWGVLLYTAGYLVAMAALATYRTRAGNIAALVIEVVLWAAFSSGFSGPRQRVTWNSVQTVDAS